MAEGEEDEEAVVAELLAYCIARDEAEGAAGLPVEVVEAISHLGIYHHNYEHHKHGLLLLKLSEEIIKVIDAKGAAKGGPPDAAVKSVKTHVVFYLAQVAARQAVARGPAPRVVAWRCSGSVPAHRFAVAIPRAGVRRAPPATRECAFLPADLNVPARRRPSRRRAMVPQPEP